MLTKFRSDQYYVINKMHLETRKKHRVKSDIKDKKTAWSEMDKLAKKFGEKLSKSGYFEHKGYYYGVDISDKELDKAKI